MPTVKQKESDMKPFKYRTMQAVGVIYLLTSSALHATDVAPSSVRAVIVGLNSDIGQD